MKEALLSTLRKLRLSGLAQTLEVRLQEAASHNLECCVPDYLRWEDRFCLRMPET